MPSSLPWDICAASAIAVGIALAAIYINNLILIYELHKLSERQFENETSQGRKIVNHHEAAVPPTPASDKEIPPRPSEEGATGSRLVIASQ